MKQLNWSEKEVFEKLRPILEDSAKKILARAKESKTDLQNRNELYEIAQFLYKKAQNLKTDSKQHNEITSNDKPSRTFKDVIGMDNLKDEIKLKVIEPLRFPEIFKKFGKKIGGGILMYGPPGCGKTLIAEAAAGEAGIPFYNVGPEVLRSKYVGESEKNISLLFKKARQTMPCIIFFDEFETLGIDREIATNHGKNEVSQLLREIDGFGNKDDNILLIAATNEPWNIDIALRRNGRFSTTIFVPPPDEKSRYKILETCLKNKPFSDIDINLITEMTEGFSGAEIVGICEDASDKVLKEFLKTRRIRNISNKDLIEAAENKKSVVNDWFKKAERSVELNHNKEAFRDFYDYLEKNQLIYA